MIKSLTSVFTYRLCRTRLICAAQSQLFQGECAGVSAGGKHNIVFSRSHPQPQHLTSFDLKFASISLPPCGLKLILVWEWQARWPRSTSPPRITSSFVRHIPGRRNMIYRLCTIFPIFRGARFTHTFSQIHIWPDQTTVVWRCEDGGADDTR